MFNIPPFFGKSNAVPRRTPQSIGLFNNPVGYFTSLAISRPGAALWGCEITFFNGSCLETEVSK
ncbi:MAG: hypothetical protein LBC88_04695, partial [Spirochaetaceae bacterium]|nr:hypothetical protein [Spirochaetaceae bacterium]